ncbi:MAG: DUF6538 domain-containing protein [Pseudomonadota bacterium]|nr:DUF6538 domain-containing protein [Pseudomonadota bacterium]
MDKKYLKRASSGLWLYRRKTPVLLKDKYGSNYIQHTLNTHSYHEAILKRNAINADIEMELAHVKRGSYDKAKFFHYYSQWRKEYEERQAELSKEDLYNPMEDAEPEQLVDSEEDAKSPAVKAAWTAMKTGKIPEEYQPTISELAEEWAKWAEDKKNAKYVSSMATYVKALVAFLGRDELPCNVTSGQAQRFIDGLLESGKSASTVTHYQSKLQELWCWVVTRERASGDNPWLNTKVEASRKKSESEHYRNFTDDELTEILAKTEYDKLNSKTWAYPYALYALPWLFPEVGNAVIGANEAVNSISSKFGKLTKGFKKLEGYKTGLHSFRGHFATALEHVGCPEEIATKLAGHKQLSLTYNLYSKYKNKDELWQYVEKIHEADCLERISVHIA